MFKQLLIHLWAIRFYSKDVHYLVKNSPFYGDHLLADRVMSKLDDAIDGVNEVCFLGELDNAPYSKDLIPNAVSLVPSYVPDPDQAFINLKNLLETAIVFIDDLSPNSLSTGEANLIGGIAENLQQMYGLVGRRVKS